MVWPATARCQVPKATAYKLRVTGEGPSGTAPAKWPRFWKAKSWPGLRPAETRSKKGVNRGYGDLELVKPLVKLPRLDSNQQPFG